MMISNEQVAEPAVRRVKRTPVTPTLEGTVAAYTTRVLVVPEDAGEPCERSVGLAMIIETPTDDRSIDPQPTRMAQTR